MFLDFKVEDDAGDGQALVQELGEKGKMFSSGRQLDTFDLGPVTVLNGIPADGRVMMDDQISVFGHPHVKLRPVDPVCLRLLQRLQGILIRAGTVVMDASMGEDFGHLGQCRIGRNFEQNTPEDLFFFTPAEHQAPGSGNQIRRDGRGETPRRINGLADNLPVPASKNQDICGRQAAGIDVILVPRADMAGRQICDVGQFDSSANLSLVDDFFVEQADLAGVQRLSPQPGNGHFALPGSFRVIDGGGTIPPDAEPAAGGIRRKGKRTPDRFFRFHHPVHVKTRHSAFLIPGSGYVVIVTRNRNDTGVQRIVLICIQLETNMVTR